MPRELDHYDHDDHYFHKDVPYIEPDYFAMNANRNMPILSTIGRGPRGYGVSAEIIYKGDGSFYFRVYNNETGETLFQSPNLDAGTISVSQDTNKPVAGEVAHAIVSVNQDGKTTSYDIYLPPGSDGSNAYLTKKAYDKIEGDVYQFPLSDLYYDGDADWASKPVPRPNDTVVFIAKDVGKIYLVFGHFQAVAEGVAVATALTYLPIPIPYVGENGNWFVDDLDTGVHAEGPKGDKGTYSAPSIEEVGSYDPIEVTDLDSDPSNAQLHFKIPMAKMILIQAELPSVADLPPFEDTPVGYAYLVNHPDDLQYDLYYRGPNAQPDTDWIIVKNWQGVPAKVITGETFHLPWGEDARVEGTPESGNEVKFDFYIPDIAPDNLITGNTPIIVTEEDSRFTISLPEDTIQADPPIDTQFYDGQWWLQHMYSGVHFGTYPRYNDYDRPLNFGDSFYIPEITVDIMGHITSAVDRSLNIPPLYGNNPITVARDEDDFTYVSHESSGVLTGTYPNYQPSNPGFGDSFYIASFYVNRYGHLESANNQDIRFPSTQATTAKAGLMSPADKAKLDSIDSSMILTATDETEAIALSLANPTKLVVVPE